MRANLAVGSKSQAQRATGALASLEAGSNQRFVIPLVTGFARTFVAVTNRSASKGLQLSTSIISYLDLYKDHPALQLTFFSEMPNDYPNGSRGNVRLEIASILNQKDNDIV